MSGDRPPSERGSLLEKRSLSANMKRCRLREDKPAKKNPFAKQQPPGAVVNQTRRLTTMKNLNTFYYNNQPI